MLRPLLDPSVMAEVVPRSQLVAASFMAFAQLHCTSIGPSHAVIPLSTSSMSTVVSITNSRGVTISHIPRTSPLPILRSSPYKKVLPDHQLEY
jgi:hypothetical protein